MFLDGNYIEYTLFMQREYGLEVVDELKQRNLAHSTIKATKEGYQALLEKYSNL